MAIISDWVIFCATVYCVVGGIGHYFDWSALWSCLVAALTAATRNVVGSCCIYSKYNWC